MIPNIVHTLGGGSGIDTQNLVEQLVELQQAPDKQRLDKREELLDTQISDFGLLRSALSDLESAVAALSNKDTFNAKSVSIPDSSLLSLTKINPSAAPGSYKLQIDQVAQAQTLNLGGFTSLSDEIGTGTLTFRFGDWDSGETTFSVNANKTGAEIVIDETNNTLQGLRDAINEADIGVQASIVSNGGTYTLLLSAPSGANNELEIVATEDVGNPGLANFEYQVGNTAMTRTQEGLDAILFLNGVQVNRDTNTITDVIEGLEFDIFNSSTTEVINLSITADKSFAETAIRDFVDAYNTFLESIEKLVDYDAEKDAYGSLRNDSLSNSLIDSVRNFLGASVPGIEDGFTILANVGVRTKLDGTLEIVEDANQINTNFKAALDKNFDLVRDFFVPKYESADSRLQINAYGPKTKAGSYEVIISQAATQGSLVLAAPVTSFDTTGKDYSFTINVDGKVASIALPDNTTYNNEAEMAAEMQSLINLSQVMVDAKASVSVTYDGGFRFVSNSYGANSNVSITSVGADAGEIGLSVASGTVGTNVVGTINGIEGFGYGNVLLPKLGSAAEGLKMIVKPGETFTTTVTFSRGFGGGLSNLINTFLANNGLITERETNLRENLRDVDDDRDTLERRTEAYRARLESQFIAMEAIVRTLNNTGTFFDNIADRLPFTAKN